MGEILRLIRSKNLSKEYYEIGKDNDVKCNYKLASMKKEKDQLENISKTYPLAYINLGNLETDKKIKQKHFEAGIKENVFYAYFELGGLFLRDNQIDLVIEYF